MHEKAIDDEVYYYDCILSIPDNIFSTNFYVTVEAFEFARS